MATRNALRLMSHARGGDVQAQLRLGGLYLDGGEGFAPNPISALMWLKRAAEGGCGEAAYLIGERIVPEDVPGATELPRLLRMAADAGSYRACVSLARLLLASGGLSGPALLGSEAVMWLRRGSDGGDPEAVFELGRVLLENGESVVDLQTGRRLLEAAWKQGIKAAAATLADHYWSVRNLREAQAWYRRLGREDDAEVCFRMAYLGSLLGEPEMRLLERAAAAGHQRACEELGAQLARKPKAVQGGRRRLKRAAYWLEQAAHRGSARASYLLAALYRHPDYSMRDADKARAWLFHAAQGGHRHACLLAGVELVRDLNAGRCTAAREIVADGGNPARVAADYLLAARRAGFGEAERFLARLTGDGVTADQVALPAQWEDFVAFVERNDADLAARLNLGVAFGLNTRELLSVDLARADQGEYLYIEISGRSAIHRRLILVENEMQRQVLDEVKPLIEAPFTRGSGAAPPKYRKLRGLAVRSGIDGVEAFLFPRLSPEVGATDRDNVSAYGL